MSRLYSVYGYHDRDGELVLAVRGLQTTIEAHAQADADDKAEEQPELVWVVEWRELHA